MPFLDVILQKVDINEFAWFKKLIDEEAKKDTEHLIGKPKGKKTFDFEEM